MRRIQRKFLIPAVILLAACLLIGGYFLMRPRYAKYYAIVEGPLHPVVGECVLVEQEVAGSVKEVAAMGKPDMHLIRFSLSRDYSLPSNSLISVIYPDGADAPGQIRIRIRASKSYYHSGDTVFIGLPVVVENQQSGQIPESVEGLVYKVQLLVSTEAVVPDSPRFKGIENIEELRVDGVYKYYAGSLSTLDDAKKLRREIVDAGISDAFIVPFIEGRRISLKEAAKYEK